MNGLFQKLSDEGSLTHKEFVKLLQNKEAVKDSLYNLADQIRRQYYDNDVYLRGLIEISNVCDNDCFYCGIRRSNSNLKRYTLNENDIMQSCEIGYRLGIRTFVLQGGETPKIAPFIARVIKMIKGAYADCAITLSLGEQDAKVYELWKRSGADRYLLRHETAAELHYKALHPKSMSLKNRLECLSVLKELGYQVGTGFMVGSPYQTIDDIASDLVYLSKFKPHMVGIGPFLPHKDTPFGKFSKGSADDTLFLMAIIRVMLKKTLIPATTSLETLKPRARVDAQTKGANVIMPNLTPKKVAGNYSLYDKKISVDDIRGNVTSLKEQLHSAGFYVPLSRGDSKINVMRGKNELR